MVEACRRRQQEFSREDENAGRPEWGRARCSSVRSRTDTIW